jgi:hypothetical protein
MRRLLLRCAAGEFVGGKDFVFQHSGGVIRFAVRRPFRMMQMGLNLFSTL